MLVQAFVAELAVERLDEGVVTRLARPREVQFDVFLAGPKVEIAGDELGDPDRLRIAHLSAGALIRLTQDERGLRLRKLRPLQGTLLLPSPE